MGVTSYLTLEGEILSETRSGVESDYIPDPQGSTAALIDSSQVITDTFTWWPYGEQRSHVGSSVTPFGYQGTSGYFTDSSSNRIYVEKRVLRPTLTRWQTVDRKWPSQRPYNYVASSPSTLIDPSGLQPPTTITSRSNPSDRLSLAQEDDCNVAKTFLSYFESPDPVNIGVISKYLECMFSSPGGLACPAPDADDFRCLVNNLCTPWYYTVVTMPLGPGFPCGGTITTPLIGCPMTQLNAPILDSDGCNHFKAGAPYHIVLMHEALHTCGVDHPEEPKGDLNCNNIMACCMLRATGVLHAWQRC